MERIRYILAGVNKESACWWIGGHIWRGRCRQEGWGGLSEAAFWGVGEQKEIV